MLRPTTASLLARSAFAAAILAALAPAQDARPIAFTNARILTMAGAPIENGTLVVKNGRILALGKDVAAPAGARVVDCAGGTLMPGLVSAHSRAGLVAQPASMAMDGSGLRRGGRRGGVPMPDQGSSRGAQNAAATKVAERLDGKQDVFGELLRAGVTTLALTPAGDGLPGLGALLTPSGRTLDSLVAVDDAFVFVSVQRDSRVKKILKDGFEAAKKAVEARKQPKEAPKQEPPKDAPPGDGKPTDGKPAEAPKEGEKKPDAPKPDQPKPQEPPKGDEKKPEDKKPEAAAPKPEEKKDPNVEVLADLIEGKKRAIVQINSAADWLHWQHAVGKDLAFPRAIVSEAHDQQAGTLDLVLDDLKAQKVAVLLPPDLSAQPRSRYATHPVKTLHDAGIEVGFVLGDQPTRVRSVFARLMELVRNGLPADVALRGVTVVPSKALGVDAQVGTLEAGKKANLLWLSGDPLDPSAELRAVYLDGKQVEDPIQSR